MLINLITKLIDVVHGLSLKLWIDDGRGIFESDIAHVRILIATRTVRERTSTRTCRLKKLPYSDRRATVTCKPSGRHCCILSL